MAETQNGAPETTPRANSELAILQIVETKILGLFKTGPEQNLAKMALFDHLYTDQESKITYSAPNAHALPYLLQILGKENQIDSAKLADSLSVVPLDVRNVRRINDVAGTTDAGDLAIALNLASLFTHDESGRVTTVGIRRSGDELLGITTHHDLPTISDGTKNIQADLTRRYQSLEGIDCSPQYKYKSPIPLWNIDLSKSRRDIDIVANMYNPSQDGRYLNNPVIAALMTESDTAIKARELDALPQKLQELVLSAGSTDIAKRLALHAALNEMYPRSEPVYNHSQFFAATSEKMAQNPLKQYRCIFVGPIGIKTLNESSHSQGDEVMRNTNRLLRTEFPDVIITQDRGSFIAWVEDGPEFDQKVAKINNTITDKKIHYPLRFIHDPAVAVTTISLAALPVDEESFWQAIDQHRPNHYFHELSLFIDKLSPNTLWKSLMPRLTSRIDQIKNLLLSAEGLKLTIHDVNLLNQTPSGLFTNQELTAYIGQMRNFLTRLDWTNKTVQPPRHRPLSSSAST